MQVFEAALSACLLAGSAQAASYTIIDLGTLPGATATTPAAINDLGQVVGTATFSGTSFVPFLWDAGSGMTALPLLSGSLFAGAGDINNASQVVGGSNVDTSPGSGAPHATRWDPDGGIVDLNDQVGGGGSSEAFAINDAGQVAGWADADGTGIQRAYLWNPDGSVLDLGILPGNFDSSVAVGINSAGTVVGQVFNYNEPFSTGFVWDPATGMTDLGKLLGSNTYSFADDINDLGQILLLALDATTFEGISTYLLDPSEGLTDLGFFARSINNHTQLVGAGLQCASAVFLCGMVWDERSGAIDLNTLIDPAGGWFIDTAEDINDLGQILASGIDGAGQAHALLLTPAPSPVPLPATLPLVAAALGGLILVQRTRRR